MTKVKEQKAITLIALVITIIVMLILASVAITLTLNNNGIFIKAKEAKEETNKQEATDIINLKITTAKMNKYAEKQVMPTLQELADVLYEDNEIEYVALERKVADKEKVTIGEETSIFTKLNNYPYEFEINNRLQLASINGIKIATNVENKAKLERKIIDEFYYDSRGSKQNGIYGGVFYGLGTFEYDISEILPEDYQNLTIENFVVDCKKIIVSGADQGNLYTTNNEIDIGISSYENGILKINLPKHVRGGFGVNLYISIIAFYIK